MINKILMHDWVSDWTADEIAECLGYDHKEKNVDVYGELWDQVIAERSDFWDHLSDNVKRSINTACITANDLFEKESAARKIESDKRSAKNKIEHDQYLLNRFDMAMDDRIDTALNAATEKGDHPSILDLVDSDIFLNAYDYFIKFAKTPSDLSKLLFGKFSNLSHCPTMADVRILAAIVDFKIDYNSYKFWDNGAGSWLLISINS